MYSAIAVCVLLVLLVVVIILLVRRRVRTMGRRQREPAEEVK